MTNSADYNTQISKKTVGVSFIKYVHVYERKESGDRPIRTRTSRSIPFYGATF